MDRDGATFEYPTSTAPDSSTLQHAVVTSTSFNQWGDCINPYAMAAQGDWSSNNNGQYSFTPNQQYLASLQTSFPMPTEQTNIPVPDLYFQHTQPESMAGSCYPAQTSASSVSPAQAQVALNSLMPGDSTSTDRPLSAGTMLDSASSNTSRPSSNSSSPSSRGRKFKVPAIKTQFESKGRAATLTDTPLSDGFQVAPDTDGMTSLSNEWMQMHDNTNGQDFHEQSLSAMSGKTTPGLLAPFEPYQWQSPMTRRTSMSSAASGPLFSPYGGTPLAALWQHAAMTSPYPQQSSWTPTSNSSRQNISPQSPYQIRNYGSLGRTSHLNSQRQAKRPKLSTMTALSLPSRKPRPVMRNATDSYTATIGSLGHSRPRTGDNSVRPRRESTSNPSSATSQHLIIPDYQMANFYASPDISHTEFHMIPGVPNTPTRHVLPSSATSTPMGPPHMTPRTNITPGFNSFNMTTPFVCSQPFPQLATHTTPTSAHANSIATPAHQPPLPVPSEPPISDFVVQSSPKTGTSGTDTPSHHNHGPIRQSPHFEGDIYTPRFKRRNAAGKWEGWCGYCQPGRWLDLKNSRYWEDKLRNHGICARTKTFFEGPTRVRWVSDRGTIWEGEPGDSGFDLAGKEAMEDDGIGRKREGLCGECKTWVSMDGMRARGKGKCVAWWMHAYKCHEQSKSKNGEI